MTHEKKHIILFRKYLSGTLDKNEKEELFRFIRSDESVLEEATEELIKEYGRMELKKQLNGIHEKLTEKKTRLLPSFLKIAAVLLVAAGIGYLATDYFLKNQKPDITNHTETRDTAEKKDVKTPQSDSLKEKVIIIPKEAPERVIAQKVKKESKSEKKMKTSEELLAFYYTAPGVTFYRKELTLLDSAYIYYKNENFTRAIYLFEKELKKATDNETIESIIYYLGNSYLSLLINNKDMKQAAQAEKYLSFLAQDETSLYAEKSLWYLAMVYLATGRREDCINRLKEISAAKKWNSEQAALLLKELDTP